MPRPGPARPGPARPSPARPSHCGWVIATAWSHAGLTTLRAALSGPTPATSGTPRSSRCTLRVGAPTAPACSVAGALLAVQQLPCSRVLGSPELDLPIHRMHPARHGHMATRARTRHDVTHAWAKNKKHAFLRLWHCTRPSLLVHCMSLCRLTQCHGCVQAIELPCMPGGACVALRRRCCGGVSGGCVCGGGHDVHGAAGGWHAAAGRAGGCMRGEQREGGGANICSSEHQVCWVCARCSHVFMPAGG